MNAPLPADYHTHTRLCAMPAASPSITPARRQPADPGNRLHRPLYFPNDPHLPFALTRDEFATFLELVRAAQAESPCTVLLGIEADYQRDLVAGHVQPCWTPPISTSCSVRSTRGRSGDWPVDPPPLRIRRAVEPHHITGG
jgi:hypothetical protein